MPLENLFESARHFLSADVPRLKESLHSVPPMVIAVICVVAGVLMLLSGWRLYRVALVLIGFLVGVAVGIFVARIIGIPSIFVALPLGIAAGVLAIYAVGFSVFVMGGLLGVLIIFMINAFGSQMGKSIAAALAFCICGALALWVWKPAVTGILAINGACLLANAVSIAGDQIRPGAVGGWMTAHPVFMSAVILAVAAGGFYFQLGESEPEPAKVEE